MSDELFPRETQAVVSIASLYMLRMLGLFMLLPVLALYAEDLTGSTPMLIGLALGAYGLTQGLLQVPFGLLSDRIGRKAVVAGGLVIFIIGSLVAATADSIYGIIAGRLLQGGGAIASTLMAFVADLTSEKNRSKAMATIGASIGVSFAISLILGPMLSAYGGLQAIFGSTALLACLGLAVLFFAVPKAVKTNYTSREIRAVPALLGSALKNPQLLRLDVGIFILHFVLMALFLVLPFMLRDVASMAVAEHWQAYLPLMFFSFVAMVPLMVVAEKKRQVKPVFLFAIILMSVSLAALSYCYEQPYLLFTLLFGFFIAFNLLEALLPSLVSKTAPAGARGTAMGVYSSSQFFGAFWGGLLGGLILQNGSAALLLQICAGLVFIWLFIASGMQKPLALKNIALRLKGVEGKITEQLLAVEGVVDAVVVEKYCRAYLKVDEKQLDREALNQFIQER